MKTIITTAVLTVLISTASIAQVGNFANRVKQKVNSKVNQRVDSKTDKAIDQTLDEIEGKGSENSKPKSSNTTTAGTEKTSAVKSYSKFDFVPGEKIIYADDFANEEMGELPLNWNTLGKAELVTLDNAEGNWLRLFPTATYLTSSNTLFTKNFTVEFDMIFDMKNNGYTYPYFSFGILNSGSVAPNDNAVLNNHRTHQAAEIFVRLSSGGATGTYLETFSEGRRHFITEQQQLSALEKYYGKVSHICMQVQESRIRVWINGEKKFDLPKALPAEGIFNNIFFRTFASSYKEEELGFYITNLKVASGLPDTRHKLAEEGKFSTTGIKFKVNSAAILEESAGTLKELAEVLKKYPDIKIRIVGHTDNDGSNASNLELSKKRAAAVKEALSDSYGIETSRMETDGRGEEEPVADNKSKEGKANNRRVEFIKL